MGIDTLFYLGVRPVAASPVDGDPGEPFAQTVKTVLGMEMYATGAGYEARRRDGLGISATFFSREEHHVFLLAFPQRIVEEIGGRVLMDMLMRLSTDWRLTLGRTFMDTGAMSPEPEEWRGGALTGLDWFQYFGPERARQWTAGTWTHGPFYQVVEQEDGSVGLCLSPDPFKRIPRRAAAEYLGISLRPLTMPSLANKDEHIVIPWD